MSAAGRDVLRRELELKILRRGLGFLAGGRGRALAVLIFGPFSVVACGWYCYAFACTVSAIRNGNLFSGDFPDSEALQRRLLDV